MADTRVIIQAEAEQAVREFNRLRAEASGSLQQIAAAGNKVVGVLQSIGVAVSAGQIVALSDEYVKFTAQLRLATESQREYGVAYAEVRRIANDSQQALASTGVLYARIAKGTQELGVSQQRVAAITETVNLALKVSGATATEAASAQLQLSQAFASNTLRGEEFNAVNEAAPRLMAALADGIGVPVGALKKMAEEGQITSKVMADVLPNALVKLREEAKQVQTVSGSFTVFKNTVMELVGVQANASGAVAALTGGIGALSDNLAFLAGTVGILLALKTAGWLTAMATQTYASVTATVASVAANNALVASNVATATSGAAAAAAANTLAISRVAELRAAVLAAEGNVALALTTNGLIPAEANAARTAAALAAANLTLAASQSAASVTARVLSASMALLSGPIGIIVTVLGAGAAAWALWGKSSEDANKLATESTEASGAEILASLEKQNQKLRDRLALAKAGNVDAAKVDSGSTDKLASTLRQINALKAKGAEISSVEQITLIDLEASYAGISRELKQNKDLTAAIGAVGAQSKAGEWMVKYASQSEKLEAELKKARTELGGAFTPELEGRIRKQYEVKAAGAAKEISAYTTLISTIRQKIAASDAEAAGLGPLTESQKLSAALNEQIAAGKLKLSPLNKAEYLAAVDQLAVNEQVIASNKRAVDGAAAMAKLEADSVEKAKSRLDAVAAEAVANERLVETFGMSKGAIEQLELARLQDQLAQRASTGMTLDEIAALEALIAAKQRNVAAVSRGEDLTSAQKSAEDLSQFLDPARAQSFGDALRDAFGGAGSALVRLTASFQSYARSQADFEKQRGNAANKYLNGKSTEIEYAKDIVALNKMQTSEQLRGYGDMAGAAASFFGEQSRGYQALTAVSQVFHAADLAMTLASNIQKGIGAVLNQANGDPYSAFGRMAAMAAIVAGLGVAIGAIGGGGGSDTTAKDRQKAAGTGSILGDSSAKSDSIARSIELAATNSSIELTHTAGMLASLKAIENSIGGLGNLLVRGSGLTGDVAGDVKGSAQQTFDKVFGLGSLGEKLTGGLLGKVVGSIFGGKVTTLDTGFTAKATSLASVAAGGLNAQQYTDIKKSGGLFSSSKNSTQTSNLGAEANDQFAKVILNISTSVKTAADLLGVGGDAFTTKLNTFVVDIGKISTKGLSGTEIQEALETVFSKLGDGMAEFGVAGLESFQKVGEGYFETLTRVATNYANLDSILASTSTTFGQTGMSSIAARERLIDLTGGIDELASQTTSFADNFLTEAERLAPVQKYVTDQLAVMGLQSLDTRDKFKEYVLGLANSGKLATESGAQQYASLLTLSEAFAKTHAATVDLTKSEQAIADERKDLQDRLDELTMTQEQLAAKARAAIDGHNLALYDQVLAAEAAQKVIAEATAEHSAILTQLGALYAATGDKAAAAAVLEQQHQAALVGLSPALAAATQATWDAQAAEQAKKDAQAESNSILSIQAQIYELTGNKAAAAAVLQKQHQAALELLSPALQATTKELWAAQAAEQAKKDALAESNSMLNIQAQIYELTGNKAAAAAVLQKQHQAALELLSPALRATTEELWAAQAAAEKQKSAAAVFDSFGSAMQTTIDKITEATSALKEFSAEINTGDLSPLSSDAQYSMSKAAVAAATPDNAQAAVTTFLKAARERDATRLEYSRDVAFAQAALQGLIDSQDGRIASTVAGYANVFKSLSAINGSHANGLEYVPFNGYRAELHAGEGVLTASENKAYRSTGGGNTELIVEVRRLGEKLENLHAATQATALNTSGTTRLLGRVIVNDVLQMEIPE